jgi:hypothetical protein
MASRAVAAAPEAISEESAKTQLADRPTETQAVVDTTRADDTTVGNAPSVAGESQQDAEHISSASADDIRSQAVAAAPTPSAPKPETAEQSEALVPNVSGSPSLVTDTAISGTLSEPDKVAEAVVPSWTTFSDLTIEEKFAQARLMNFEVRDAYLRERCCAAKMEVAHAASALDRATAIIETNLPIFLIHFQDMDAQGERSDLKGKVMGKTEWLRQNLPNISRGTFYAAYNSVKARYAEQERLMLGGDVPQLPQRITHFTQLQKEVLQAVIGQGYKEKDARSMVKDAAGNDFESLFRSALNPGPGNPSPPSHSSAPTPPDPAPAVVAEPSVRIDQSSEEKLDDEAESGGPTPPVVDPPIVEPIATVDGGESAPAIPADPQIEHDESGEETVARIRIPQSANPEIAELKKEIARLPHDVQLRDLKITDLAEAQEAHRAENENLRRRIEAINTVPEHLRDDRITASLAAEPDTLQAGERVKIYFNSVGERVLPPNMELGVLSVSVRIVGRTSRIVSGDYLEKRNKAPQPPTLCKCSVEVSEAGRQKVSEWGAGGWGKPHVIYSSDETDYKVIDEEAARKLAPAAFPAAAAAPTPAKTPEGL